MIAKMLSDLGLFIGRDLEDNNEATFFLKRNNKILDICNATWYNVNFVDVLLNHSSIRKQITNYLRDDLGSFQALSFLGPKYFLKYRSALKLDLAWGWKDPRNTLLLPLWLDIFPDAKVIHIYRNGIDVANSVSVRELTRRNDVLKSDRAVSKIIESQKRQFKNSGILLYLIRKLSIRYEKMDPLHKYNKIEISSVMSLNEGFEVWCTYIKRAVSSLENIQNSVLQVKYEDFLLQPEYWLERLNEFCSLSGEKRKIKSIAAKVNRKRRYAFINDPFLMKFYDNVKENYFMCKLGYDNLEEGKRI